MDIKKIVKSYKDEIISSIQDIVRIKSVESEPKEKMPFGEGVDKTLKFALGLGEKMGFDTKNVDNYAGYIEYGDGAETVGVLIHLDVVPEGEGWTYPPYAAEIHDNKIFGRGAFDNKGSFIACLYAMKAIKESGLPINRKIRMILGTNEETGFKGVRYFLQKEKAPDMTFVPDADFPVLQGEKGILVLKFKKKFKKGVTKNEQLIGIKGGTALNAVPETCNISIQKNDEFKQRVKSYIMDYGDTISFIEENDNPVVNIKGKAAHGSLPEKGLNAISLAMKMLKDVYDESGEIHDFIRLYNNKIGMEYNGQSMGCGLSDELSGKLTLNVGTISLDEEVLELGVDIRYPITSESEKILDIINKELEETGFEICIHSQEDPIYFEKDHFLIKTLMKVYQEETGDLDSKPHIIGGATYARTMKNAVAFGPLFPGQEMVAHQKDEFISIDHLMKCTDIYSRAMLELAK